MLGNLNPVLAGLALSGIVLAAQSTTAAAVERIACRVIVLVDVKPGGPTGTQSHYVVLTNSTSAVIPAQSVFTYVLNGQTLTYRSMMTLPIGEMINIKLASNAPVGACEATVVPTQPDNIGVNGQPIRR